MTKKKATMTLKDFHGGSIPSDLPLPSAPGVIVRSTNDHRPGYERQTSWGNPMNRTLDNRLRPSSSGSIRNSSLGDNALFLGSNANIGRNFDEDERTPLDGGPSAPRRIVSADIVQGPIVRSEPRGDVGRVSGGREGSGFGLSSGGSSYSARVVEGANAGVVSVGTRPNAWGVRKEVAGVGVNEKMSNQSGGGHNTVSKFAQASALDQVSSGRWQTKPVHQQVDVEVIRQSDSPNSLYARESEYFSGAVGLGSEREYIDTTLVRHVERGLAVEEVVVERVRSPGGFDGKEQSSVLFTNNGQPAYPEGRYGISEALVVPGEKISEKPKLKLLPRTKPMEVPEPYIVDYKQGPQLSINTTHLESGTKSLGNGRQVKPVLSSNEVNHVKPGLSSSEAANQAAERPKLNLKPRSQPLDKSEVNTERKGIPLFGGARPREAVLKERGVDDVLNTYDEVLVPIRTRNDILKAEVSPTHKNSVHHAQRNPNHSTDNRPVKVHDKKEQDVQKTDIQRKNNWRSVKETEKQPQQERAPSPETWRKPIQQTKPSDTENSLRFGKVVSAVELAQAFSRPVPIPMPADHFSGQRGLPGRTQVPFSRLTGSTPRPQVNGF